MAKITADLKVSIIESMSVKEFGVYAAMSQEEKEAFFGKKMEAETLAEKIKKAEPSIAELAKVLGVPKGLDVAKIDALLLRDAIVGLAEAWGIKNTGKKNKGGTGERKKRIAKTREQKVEDRIHKILLDGFRKEKSLPEKKGAMTADMKSEFATYKAKHDAAAKKQAEADVPKE